MKVNVIQQSDDQWRIAHHGSLADAIGMDFATRSKAREYAAIRGWQVVPKRWTGDITDQRHKRISDILIAHEKESGSNIRELYSLTGKIMAEIGTWKEEKPRGKRKSS